MRCHPDYVLIMIGTNDVRAIYKDRWSKKIQRTWKLPQVPSLENYEYNLKQILTDIQDMSPLTTIGVCTLPPMGEDLKSEANELVRKANVIIEKTVNSFDQKCTVVPIYEKFESILEKKPNKKSALSVDYFFPVCFVMSAFFHLLPGFVTWKTLSKPFGHLLLSDALHLNERGAETVNEVIVDWLFKNNIPKAIAAKQWYRKYTTSFFDKSRPSSIGMCNARICPPNQLKLFTHVEITTLLNQLQKNRWVLVLGRPHRHRWSRYRKSSSYPSWS